MKEIESKIIIPEQDKYTPVKVLEAQYIHDFIRENNLKRTLEIGLAYGRSAAYIITATGSKHIAIDPFQDKYQNLGLENLKNLNLDKHLDFHNDYSHTILPGLLGKGQYDFIFLDGDHKFDGVFVDFYFSDLLLESNGYIMFHDTWMRGIILTVSWIKKNRKDYKYIKTPLRNIALFKKEGSENRDWTHFNEFYTNKSRIKHGLISWFNKPGGGFIKNTLIKIKDSIK